MSATAMKKPSIDTSRIGEHAAMQPLSGVSVVRESSAVNGMGHNAYVRQEESGKDKK